jgi:hypothetical protein
MRFCQLEHYNNKAAIMLLKILLFMHIHIAEKLNKFTQDFQQSQNINKDK